MRLAGDSEEAGRGDSMAEEDKFEGLVRISEAPPVPKVNYKGTDKPILLVDAVVVQNSVDLGMFYVSFFQNDFRIDDGPPAEVGATCIGRFGINPQGIGMLISALQNNFARFQRAVEEEYKKELQSRSGETKA
jgi:hypothetical protein